MRVKGRTFVWCSAFGVLLAAVLIFGWKRHLNRTQAELADALAETDRIDPGWRLADIEAQRAAPPRTSDGPTDLELVQMAMDRFPALPWPLWPFPQLKDNQEIAKARQAMNASLRAPFAEEQIRALKAELGRAQASLGLLRKLPEAPHAHLDESSPAWAVLNRSDTLYLMELLKYDSRLRTNNRDMHGAMTDVIAMLALARSAGDAPSFRIQWHRLNSFLLPLGSLLSILSVGEVADADLVRVQRELAEEINIPHALMGLRSERARADAILDQFQKGDISLAEACYLLTTEFELLQAHASQTVDRIRLLADLDAERAQLLRSWLPMIELARGKSADIEDVVAKRRGARLSGSQTMPDHLLSADVFRIDEVLVGEIWLRRHLASAVCALAAERFRLANGHWPNRFEELVPQYLDAIPPPVSESPLCSPVHANSMFKVGSLAIYDVDKRRLRAKP